jgi:HK97 family phage portal protein
MAGTLSRARQGREIKSSPFAWPAWRQGQPQWHLTNFDAYVEEGFNLNSLVYSAIMYKVRALYQVLLRAYKGDPDHPEPLEADDPLQKLCDRPNPHQSSIVYQALQEVYLNLDGNAYALMVRPGGQGLPEEMYSLRPDRVYIIPGQDKRAGGATILGYLYVPEGKSAWAAMNTMGKRRALDNGDVLAIPPEDICHVKLPNPADPLEGMGYGLSPLAPAAQSADIDNRVTSFLKLFFDRGTMFQGVLAYDVPLEPDTVALIRERWQELYGGSEKWAEIGILDQGGKYERVSPTFEEMGFREIDSRDEARIISPFGVPGILIGTRSGMERSTFANYEEGRRSCWQDTLIPELALFEAGYRYYLQGDKGEFVMFDTSKVPALQKDVPVLVAAWVSLVSTGVPKDVASEVVGLAIPPLPDGKVQYMPMSLVPLSSGGEEALPAEPAILPAVEKPAGVATEDENAMEGAAEAEDQAENPPEGKTVFDVELERLYRDLGVKLG